MKSVPALGWHFTHFNRQERERCSNTSFKSPTPVWFLFHMVCYLFIYFFLFHPFLFCFQLFNECLHSACYCLKPSSKRQTSLHSTTHYGASALCPQFLSFLTSSDSCRVRVCPICGTLEVMLSRLSPVFNIFLSAKVVRSCVPTPTRLSFMCSLVSFYSS